MVITMREEEKQKRSPAGDPGQTVLLVGDFFWGIFVSHDDGRQLAAYLLSVVIPFTVSLFGKPSANFFR